MKKIFKSRRIKKFKLNFLVKLLLISFFLSFFLSKFNIFYNEKFINKLKKISLNEIEISDIKLNGEYLINIGLSSFDDIEFTKEVFKQKEISKSKISPRIYIYNTHQTEEYATLTNYNLTPTVLTASYILKDKLKNYGIESIVESSDLKKEMNRLGYSYNQAYSISRNWLDKLENENMDLYIDLHRDSLNYEFSNAIIDGKDYAKIMFVIGTNHDYSANLKVVNNLLENIESINKSISRGIFTRNYIYNQDYSSNCVLIELGGPESTYESISNTLDVLALAIKNYLGE